MAHQRRLRTRKKVLFGLFATCAFFALLEGALRLFGFERSTTVASMRFTFPMDDFNTGARVPFLERDPVLFWKPKAHVLGHNSQGLIGPEFAVPKPAGLFRIVCLGDSCTHFGPVPYPQRLQAMLDAGKAGRFEVINAGVIGWSSHQGLLRLQREVADWEPDLITVYFGWNDHWLARGFGDRDQPAQGTWLTSTNELLDHLRLYQLLMLVKPQPVQDVRHRVEPSEYAENLRQMKGICDRLGMEIWFLTAPHTLDLGLPDYLVTSGEVDDPDGLVDLHGRYNEQVRQVAEDVGARVIDLDQKFEQMNKEFLLIGDRIHLSDAGLTQVAQILHAAMVDRGLVSQPTGP